MKPIKSNLVGVDFNYEYIVTKWHCHKSNLYHGTLYYTLRCAITVLKYRWVAFFFSIESHIPFNWANLILMSRVKPKMKRPLFFLPLFSLHSFSLFLYANLPSVFTLSPSAQWTAEIKDWRCLSNFISDENLQCLN